jgi:hypothetical protein
MTDLYVMRMTVVKQIHLGANIVDGIYCGIQL